MVSKVSEITIGDVARYIRVDDYVESEITPFTIGENLALV